MKTKRLPIFTAALNSATAALNSVRGVVSELSLPADVTREFSYRLSPFGEFPVTDVRGKDIIQVVDREAGETLAANFGSLRMKFATFFKGIPIYVGHPDDPAWLEKNPGHRAEAIGRLKSIDLRGDGSDPDVDGVWVTGALNATGIAKLSGDAPEYTGHSPNWRLSQIPGRPGYFRPILLWSDGLTNMPNIMTNTIALNSLQGVGDPSPDADQSGEPENQETNMKLTPEALKALGLAPDAEPTTDVISAAIIKLASDQAQAKADMATAQGETTAANSRATRFETELKLVRGTAVDTVLTDAINSGRITEADKGKWTDALNTDFAGESAKLTKLMPVLNTSSQIAGQVDKGRGQLATTTEALNSAVRVIATENGLDLTKTADYDRAWAMLRTAKPELFSKG